MPRDLKPVAPDNAEPTPRRRRVRPVIAILIIVALVALAGLGYFYYQYDQLRRNPDGATTAEVTSLTTQVGKIMALPQDETPTLATVNDKAKLESQPFFSGVQNGDKILIYTTARKAILYRPSTGKVINVGPLALTGDAAGTTAAPTPTAAPSASASPRR